MNTEESMEDQLWDYIDGLSSPAARSAVESLIAINTEWRRKYQELLDMHQLMTGSELDAPSMRFTRNVMEEITRYQVAPATKNYINKNIIRGIGASFLCLIAGLLIYCLGQFKWSGNNNSSRMLPSYNLNVDKYVSIDKYDYGKIFSSLPVTLFMLVAIVLGFVLLDMYLQRKKHPAI